MTEERNCGTCKFSSFNNGTGKSCGSLGVYYDCDRYSKWQPIHKAPSFQTEGEAREKLNRIIPWGLIESQNEEAFLSAFIGNLKDAGYIRKSELVELVEEAEKILNNDSDYYTPHDIGIVAKGFKALKKDHPEFGGKK